MVTVFTAQDDRPPNRDPTQRLILRLRETNLRDKYTPWISIDESRHFWCQCQLVVGFSHSSEVRILQAFLLKVLALPLKVGIIFK